MQKQAIEALVPKTDAENSNFQSVVQLEKKVLDLIMKVNNLVYKKKTN